MAEGESRTTGRAADRLQAARWNGDDEALDLALEHSAEMVRDRLKVPIGHKRRTGRNNRKGCLDEAIQVLPEDGFDEPWIVGHDFVLWSAGVAAGGWSSGLPSRSVGGCTSDP